MNVESPPVLSLGLSPCPNDTYLFYAWIAGIVGQSVPVDPSFYDIEKLNQMCISKQLGLSKVSVGCLPLLLDDYIVLRVGAALGFGCGPKIIANIPISPSQLPHLRIAIPGKHTTAHLLLQRLLPHPMDKVFCVYHEAPKLLEDGIVDLALIIHEHRFTFQRLGFYEVLDLGEMWEETYSLPIPLGCLVAKRDLTQEAMRDSETTLQASLSFAKENPSAPLPYILQHSQEKDPDIVMAHIHTYVTEESYELSSLGKQSIESLLALPPDSEWIVS